LYVKKILPQNAVLDKDDRSGGNCDIHSDEKYAHLLVVSSKK
jgi:hypothetical protein